MSAWIEEKYIHLVASRLRNFKKKQTKVYNFSCPFCGDSQTSKLKARGYFYEKKDKFFYSCHNCGVSKAFFTVLKEIDPMLYKEFVMENFKEGTQKRQSVSVFTQEAPVFKKQPPYLTKLKKVSQLSPEHPLKKYVVKRGIPNFYHSRLYLCPKFATWTNTMLPNKMPTERDSPRLIIPMFDPAGNMFGYQGRSFDPKTNLRYITIILNEDLPKLYGMDTCDIRRPHYVVEGGIDSMFIPNCIATFQGDLSSALSFVDRELCTFIPDRDTRNKEVMGNVKKLIDAGLNVCMLPDNLGGKDINEIVLSGVTPEYLMEVIKKNTYSKLEAQLHFMSWRKDQ